MTYSVASAEAYRFPLSGLLALATAGFITILTEALPAGLLPQIGANLLVSEALAGQLVTIYALGSLVAAIPLTAATQGVRRRPLLLIAMIGFAVANTVTAISADYILTILARLTGVSAGLLWALLADYAGRMVPDHMKGRAIAVAMIGTPLALSLGIPAGTFIGSVIGWRACFGLMSVLALILIGWVMAKVPDFPGRAEGECHSLGRVFAIPGVRPVLFVTFSFVLAHNILYTYIAPFLAAANMVEQTDLVLLVFGVNALGGIGIVGVLIDRRLRELTLVSTVLFRLSHWESGTRFPAAIYMAVGGIAFGGAATLFQTAIATAAGEAADVAQSMLVTAWNIAIAGGGIVGGLLLEKVGAHVFAPALLCLLRPTLIVSWAARRKGFPKVKAA